MLIVGESAGFLPACEFGDDARYLHVADTEVRSTTSPLELLDPLDIIKAASTFLPER